jgi:hypothetical protein
MKIIKSILVVSLWNLLFVNKSIGQAVAPAIVMQYLQSKINIYFLNAPNTATPVFHTISTANISANTNGILFGRGGNNGMTQSARLLLSLFRDRTQSSGDGRLQDFVYQAMNLRNKTIDIIFMNDQFNSIDPSYFIQYGGIDTFRVGRNLHIWPTTVMPNSETSAGTIILGEKIFRGFSNLQQSKNILLNLITSIAVADYRSMHMWWVFTQTLSVGDTMRFTYSMMDARYKTNQGVCNAIRYVFDNDERERAIKWFGRKANFVEWRSAPRNANNSPVVPAEYWLYDQLQNDDLLNRGLPLSNPPFSARTARNYKWMHYSLSSRLSNTEIYKYAARDEILIGLLGDTYMRFINIGSFWDALKFDNNRFFSAEPKDRLAILIENLCLSQLNGSTLQQVISNPPAEKKYLIGIALLDFISNYSSGGDVRQFNRYWFLGGSISPELGEAYRQIRPSIMTAMSAVAGQGYRAQIEVIKTVLNIN